MNKTKRNRGELAIGAVCVLLGPAGAKTTLEGWGYLLRAFGA